jgi:hypothetical protein
MPGREDRANITGQLANLTRTVEEMASQLVEEMASQLKALHE